MDLKSIKVSLIIVVLQSNIIVVTYSKCHRLSLSLIVVDGITRMG
jgi:hypothetical protein